MLRSRLTKLSLRAIVCISLWLAVPSAASATSSLNVSATAAPGTVTVQVSGFADPCSYCSGQEVQIEVDPGASSFCGLISPQYSADLPATGGPISATTSESVTGGQQATVCAAISDTAYGATIPLTTSQPVILSVPPANCAPDTQHALGLVAPPDVAYGAHGNVEVVNNDTFQSFSNVTISMADAATGRQFFTQTLTSGEVSALANDTQQNYYIELNRHDGPAVVALKYQQDVSDVNTGQCIDVRTATVSPVSGTAPRAQLLGILSDNPNGAAVRFMAPGGCDLTKPVSETIQVRSPSGKATITSRDECLYGFSLRGRLPGVSVRQDSTTGGSRVLFLPAGRGNYEYRLSVRIGHRIVERGWLTKFYDYQAGIAPQRVYEGTDAFVNYCIDQTKTIYSYHLRLFCWSAGLPATTNSWVMISKLR